MPTLAALAARAPWLRGRFARDASTLVSGLIASQVISLAAAPLLTRLYSPAEFGALASFSAIVTSLAIVACLVYEPAIVLPERDEDGAVVLMLCLLIAAVFSAAVAAAVAWRPAAIARWIGVDSAAEWLWWVPAALMLMGVYQSVNYWSTRRRHFGAVALSRALQSGTTAASQLAGRGPGGLVAGMVAGQVAATAILSVRDGGSAWSAWRRQPPTPRRLIWAIREYRRFPLYSSWGTFMNSASFQVVPLALAAAFGEAVAGWYFLCLRLASVPMSFVGAALGQVVLQRSAETLAKGEPLGALVERVVGKSILFGLAPFILLALTAPWGFAIVFGEAWRPAGVLLSLLTPLFFAQFLTSPISSVLYSMQRQDVVAWIQVSLLAGAILSLAAGAVVLRSAPLTVALYSAVQTGLYVVYLAAVVRSAQASPRRIFREAVSIR